jgi:hypothetical protein
VSVFILPTAKEGFLKNPDILASAADRSSRASLGREIIGRPHQLDPAVLE